MIVDFNFIKIIKNSSVHFPVVEFHICINHLVVAYRASGRYLSYLLTFLATSARIYTCITTQENFSIFGGLLLKGKNFSSRGDGTSDLFLKLKYFLLET